MKNLAQEMYEDDNGHPVPASEIDVLTSYKYIADGFYKWACGACGVEHSDRWHSPSGRVLVCKKNDSSIFDHSPDEMGCGKKNLLVRTNCTEITTALGGMWQADAKVKEAERLVGIKEHNQQQMHELRRRVLAEVGDLVHAAANKVERGE